MKTNRANPITPPRASLRLDDLVLLAAILLLMIAASSNALAGSAAWSRLPSSGDWNAAINWEPQTVPNGASDTATFVVSFRADVSLSAGTEVNGIVFHRDWDFHTSASTSPIVGTFSNLPDGSTFTSSGTKFKVKYTGGDGNDLTLKVVK